ncbi:MAG TPA: polysaccharide biosynthesis tyrosine autokinase [Candidatus Eisenbacteria bacterium]|uniref:Polysaccharide biosynthesis tyrosine autokinase n=1 Tax=Eiseniibacteriota bacterium TaxID=2212470 RepID=A0A7V2AUP4_UNCEI|nr:polysaccharide biosynthesis tyrosine autokinase [Candidatus Eisenbacteria bacterium]
METSERKSIYEIFDQESPIATEMRRLYSNIRHGHSKRDMRSFLVTSSHRGEGKSTVASHLALTVARFRGKKSLIVDADLRRPRLHDIFDVPQEPGLAECLEGKLDPLDAVKETPEENLKVIPAGRLLKSPAHLFEGDVLSEIFEKIKFYYDIVIVDSAPVIPVSDPMLISSEVDGVILVILAGRTPRNVAMRAKKILEDADANILGAVVNNLSEVLPYYYDYRYYGYTRSEAT